VKDATIAGNRKLPLECYLHSRVKEQWRRGLEPPHPSRAADFKSILSHHKQKGVGGKANYKAGLQVHGVQEGASIPGSGGY
jgi:hypothetical protein